jgi:hypothetical protein
MRDTKEAKGMKGTPVRSLRQMFDRLAAEEDDFLRREFLAPVPAGGRVRVRLAGVVCTLRVAPADFRGWGVFRPRSLAEAELLRPATLAERRAYLDLLPRVSLLLVEPVSAPAGGADGLRDGLWEGLPAHAGGGRLRLDGAVPVHFVDGGERFERIRGRFDGAIVWHDGSDPAGDPATAAALRQSLAEGVAPDGLARPGLTPEQRAAYRLVYERRREARRQAERASVEGRLRLALAHGGADLVSYAARDGGAAGDGGYRVTYTLDGRRYVSAVDGRLNVQTAGICLSGHDRRFDLGSLVGVLREAEGAPVVGPGGISEDWHSSSSASPQQQQHSRQWWRQPRSQLTQWQR